MPKINPKGMGNYTMEDMMLDVFAGDKVYGSSFIEVGKGRHFNPRELARLNLNIPAVVAEGQFGLYAKFFLAGSTTTYFCKNLDTRSVATVGSMFDPTKCFITVWNRPDTGETKVKILVPQEALV